MLTRRILVRAYLLLGPIEAACGLAAYAFVLWRGGWRPGASLAPDAPLYLAATTACLTGIVLAQVANLFVFRERPPWEGRSGAANPLISLGLAFEMAILLAIVYTPLGHAVIGTSPIDAATWLVPLPFMVLLLVVGALTKRFARGWPGRART